MNWLRTACKKCLQCCLPTKILSRQCCLSASENVVNPACLPPKMLLILPAYQQKIWTVLPAYLQKRCQSCLPTSKNVSSAACLPPKMSPLLRACSEIVAAGKKFIMSLHCYHAMRTWIMLASEWIDRKNFFPTATFSLNVRSSREKESTQRSDVRKWR